MRLIARPGKPPQYLEEHLPEVSENILQAIPQELKKEIRSQIKWPEFIEMMQLLGLLHDIGKGESSVQKALQEDRKPTLSHSALSLPFFLLVVRKKMGLEFCENKILALAAFSLLSHHSVPHQSLEEHLASQIASRVEYKKIHFNPQTFELVNKLLSRWGLNILEEGIFEELKRWVKGHIEEICNWQISNFVKGDTNSRKIFVAIYNTLVKADWASAAGEKIEMKKIESNLYKKGINIAEPSRSEVHSYVALTKQCKDNILLEMPTGFGKTYIGTTYAFKTGRRKIIYTLPITTIIEDVYERLKKELGDENVKWYTSRYLALKTIEEPEYGQIAYQDAKYFNAPIIVTTLDQILITWLNIDRYPLKEFPLYYSSLILDEPQLYSPFMLLLFSKLFPEYTNSCNLVVMSATIPSFFRENLKGMIIEPFKNKIRDFFSKYSRTYFNLDYLNIPLLRDGILSDDAREVIKKHIEDKDKIAIVVNTVRRAQEIFEQIEYANKFLFHARYIFRDKRNKLRNLKEFLERKPGVIVTTQLIEAGVNVSFDAMIREVAPLDSLIQSAGRVNRYGESNNPKPIYIFGTEKFLPYRKHQIKITTEILKNWTEGTSTEILYYERLLNYWNELENWIIKDENEADKVLKNRNK
ncbi:MAG: CRISPR-associated helicase Cas3', partial [Candidatus Aerophobetes bacterium]|nr:CRISPR-associated helicase Cas3' [Candidatus Aerophobetes bacterium]